MSTCNICGTAAGQTYLEPAERAGALARLITMPDGSTECDECNNGLLAIILNGPPDAQAAP